MDERQDKERGPFFLHPPQCTLHDLSPHPTRACRHTHPPASCCCRCCCCRWPIIRSKVNPLLFQAFALVFIALIQNLLLLAITAPAYVAWQHRAAAPLNWLDALAAVLVAGFIAMEGVADQQQWEFQVWGLQWRAGSWL
jgi:hypothetical protein